jgi:ABC-type multidrug transport system ATPase subunit
MGAVTRITETIKLVSLLQPPPETVALFDEVILLSNGKVVYSGPIDEVIDYFCNLGYEIPERMDVADWLQALPTKDGVKFLRKVGSEMMKHLSTDEFVEKFYSSPRGNKILERLNAPSRDGADMVKTLGGKRFENSSFASLRLLIRRELKLWWRDKYQIKATLLKSLIMGIVAGTLFWQSDSPNSIVSILFQSMFYSCVGAMTSIVKQFAERPIFYKQQDANFFPTWTYVVGRSVASVPTSLIDSVGYGTIIFWFVGLAHNDGATVGNYFMFLLLLFVVSLTAVFFFSVFSASVSVVTIAQPCQAITMLAFILFSGFTVQPDVIPVYFIWIYWINFFAWILRGLAVNEFDSGKYDDEAETSEGLTEGELILTRFGFTINDDPFSREWVWWGLLFAVGCTSISLFLSTFFLDRIRFATGASLVTDKGSDEIEDLGREEVNIPFKRAKLTFRDVHYTVTASTSEEKLELLKGVDGVVEAGLMTALMGSSGAGKTTLMDVLAMRKSSGEISGDIRVNGHPQEKLSFRRMMGYVEQFDIQTPQLTIRETVSFSAKLRLEEKVAAVVPGSMEQFVEQTLHTLELTNIQDLQVGSDETGGLSFEQRKRLSIAIELVANPSILFLDEPTSGLVSKTSKVVPRLCCASRL